MRKRDFWIWTILLILSSVADIYMTVTRASGFQDEANPIMRFFWQNHGILGMIALKTVGVIILIYFANKKQEKYYLIIPTIGFILCSLTWCFY